jgi:hypothetical protein
MIPINDISMAEVPVDSSRGLPGPRKCFLSLSHFGFVGAFCGSLDDLTISTLWLCQNRY